MSRTAVSIRSLDARDSRRPPDPERPTDVLPEKHSDVRIHFRSPSLIRDTRTEAGYTDVVAAKKSQHGGYRPGSGRKPVLSDPKAIKVSLDGETYDRLADAAAKRETSIGALVREAIEMHLPKRRRRGRK